MIQYFKCRKINLRAADIRADRHVFHNSRLNDELNIKAKSSFFLKANDSSPFVTVIICGVKLVTFFEGWVKGSISRLRLLSVHDGLKQFL